MDITYSRIPASQASGGFFTFEIRLTRFLIFLFPDGAKKFYPLEPALSKVHSPSANAFNGGVGLEEDLKCLQRTLPAGEPWLFYC
jgi:hypothetical protein